MDRIPKKMTGAPKWMNARDCSTKAFPGPLLGIDLGHGVGRQQLLVLFDTLARPSMLRRLREMHLEDFYPK